VANQDGYQVNANGTLSVFAPGILANDTDPQGNPLQVALVSNPHSGNLTQYTDGSFTYIPNTGFYGQDYFLYQAQDKVSGLLSNVATVTITVVNQPPVANNDAYQASENGVLSISGPGVLANDTDAENDPLTAVQVQAPGSGPSHGVLSFPGDGSFTYTPNTGFSGQDSFQYQAQDVGGLSNVATVNITVVPNQPPIANNDTYFVDGTLIVSAPGVLANDTTLNNDTLTSILLAGPSHGSLSFNNDGSFSYTPSHTFVGTDAFTYKAHDVGGDSNVATVTLTVTNLPPVAHNDAYLVNENTALTMSAPGVLGNDTDYENDPLTALFVHGPAHGSLTFNADGSFMYTPNHGFYGQDSFKYKAHDTGGDSNVATVTIKVVNQPPIAVNDAYSVAANQVLMIVAPGVLANDTDAENDPMTTVLYHRPAHGTLSLNANGSFTYTPNHDFAGQDYFYYRARDLGGFSNVATVQINVAPANAPAFVGLGLLPPAGREFGKVAAGSSTLPDKSDARRPAGSPLKVDSVADFFSSAGWHAEAASRLRLLGAAHRGPDPLADVADLGLWLTGDDRWWERQAAADTAFLPKS
jgi:hypothetical protein